MPYWKPTSAQRRTIREYAARAVRKAPRQIDIDVGERCPVDETMKHTAHLRSFNVLDVDSHPDWENSDLCDLSSFTNVRAIPLKDGNAVVDFYIYGNNRDRELLTNVQAYVETVQGKPTIIRLETTDGPSLHYPETDKAR